ncbi:trigger factor [Patescibacteria group bacterium]
MKFSLTIKKSEIKKGREQVLKNAAKKINIKGFRKGNAPETMVAEHLGEKAIIESTLDLILPKAYADEVIKKKLKPISNPRINPKKIDPGSDWEFEIEIAQKPKVVLGKYKENVKKAQKALKKPKKDEKSLEEDKKLKATFDTLLEKIEVKIPDLLVDDEVNNQLSRLLDQIQKLGLTLEQYLDSMKISKEKLKKNYEKTAKENLKLEFILQEIIKDQDIKVLDKEINDLINASGDEEVRKRLSTPEQKQSIAYSLAKRRAVDSLLKDK